MGTDEPEAPWITVQPQSANISASCFCYGTTNYAFCRFPPHHY
jgi:hypothetical protein